MDRVATKCAGWGGGGAVEWREAYLFYFYEGRKRVIQCGKVLLQGGGGRGGGALGMMKRLNLLLPCNQFVTPL